MSGALRDDRFTTTLGDAAAYERARGDWDDADRPSRSDLAREAELDRQAGPRVVDPADAHRQAAEALRIDLLHAYVGVYDLEVSIHGLAPSVVRIENARSITREDVSQAAYAWLERSPRWDVLRQGEALFARPAGAELEIGPPF